MVSVMIRVGLVLGALALVGCGGSDAPGSAERESGSSSAGTTSQATSDATEQTHDAEPTDACEIGSGYGLVAVLTSGADSCSSGVEYERVTIQTKNEIACTAVVCVDGLNCVHLDCDRGDPVTECSTTVVRNGADACTYVWTLSRN